MPESWLKLKDLDSMGLNFENGYLLVVLVMHTKNIDSNLKK